MLKVRLGDKKRLLGFVGSIAMIFYSISSNAAISVDLRGKAPESKTITINVSKPSAATSGLVTLATFDADFPNEGELVINGNAPVILFGSSGNSGNDQNSADVSISTPASYWKNGANTLLIRHTKTQGFVVDDVKVFFKTETAGGSGGAGTSFPVDLRGKAPESKSITINVSKPSGATSGLVTLATFDADFPNEGELVINGNAPVILFGSSGNSGNDQNSADVSISTPASYWKNGANTLLIRHTKTQGFVVDDVKVFFKTETAGGSGGAGTSFPVDLRGKAPESKSITINVSKPSGATSGLVTLATYDADFPNEGELVINGNAPVILFGSSGNSGNDQNSADVSISTPASYWKNGANTLLIRHTKTQGFVVDDVKVLFKTGNTGNSGGAGTSFPVDLRGKAPESKSITINVSKPSGATSGLVTLATFDADFPNEGELVINGNAPVILFGASGNSGNDQNSADVSISTPASYWKNGANTLLIRHTKTQGFVVDNVKLSFSSTAQGGQVSTAAVRPLTGSDIFNLDFENRQANTAYTEAQVIEDFNANKADGGVGGPSNGNTRIVLDPVGNTVRGNVLRVRHPAGKFGEAVSFKARFARDNSNKKGSARFDDTYFAYDIYLPLNTVLMPVHKLPGLITGTLLEASHLVDRQTVVKSEGIRAFSARMTILNSASYPAIPVGKGALVNYVYDAQQTRNLDFLNTSNPSENIDSRLGANVHKLYLMPTGRWVTIEQRVKLNTADSNNIYNSNNDLKDGLMQIWVDGQLMLSRKHLWRWTNTMKADGFWFTDFYNDRPELSSPPSIDQFVYYDNFRVSTSPITH